MGKITREKFKIRGNVFDDFTERLIFKLEGKYFDHIKSPVSIGKEANIFTATGLEEKDSEDTEDERRPVILKIYRLENCEFNKMYEYIKVDPRYSNLKKKKREIVFSWAQREFRNLLKARESGVRVPIPIHCERHILVLEQIGKDCPAPKLKDQIPQDIAKFYDKVAEEMKRLYKGGLVHGDLSAFNILNDCENPVFIDFSQSTTTQNPMARELLDRDVKNICDHFKKIGLKTDEQNLRKQIKEAK
ncbi:serine protein kinase RIO [Candidatus Woesearchaeota archaeon]|jgi:RIO kinase 1|nr:serine protein kinase RIO [Candidatus Woesearchaeota archaeon]